MRLLCNVASPLFFFLYVGKYKKAGMEAGFSYLRLIVGGRAWADWHAEHKHP